MWAMMQKFRICAGFVAEGCGAFAKGIAGISDRLLKNVSWLD
jgi:hypothetical protein